MLRRILKVLRELEHYPRFRHKALSLYNLVLVSRKLRPLPLPGRGSVVQVNLRGHTRPFGVRLGSTDWLVLVEVFLDGEYAPARDLCDGCSLGTIVDLGSNAGFSVRYWLERFPGTRVIAVEPDAGNVAMMRQNIALAQSATPPVLVQACIVGRPRERVFLEQGSPREWAFAIAEQESSTTVPVRAMTLDQLLTHAAVVGKIGMLKCDIEGAEADLFEHCDSWIQSVERLVVEVHGDFSPRRLISMLNDKGVQLEPHATNKPELCLFVVKASRV
jgi:FkbM family methyltransferase